MIERISRVCEIFIPSEVLPLSPPCCDGAGNVTKPFPAVRAMLVILIVDAKTLIKPARYKFTVTGGGQPDRRVGGGVMGQPSPHGEGWKFTLTLKS